MRSFRHGNNRKMAHTHTHTQTHITHYVNMEMLTVLYQAAHTDREVTANRPNMTIKNKKEKICIMIEVEILAGRESHAKGSRKRS